MASTFLRNLKIKWKILFLVLPLVIVPIMTVGYITGYISTKQAYRGITTTSMADLDHMAEFTRDILSAYLRQFSDYRHEKKAFEDIKQIIKNKKVGETGYIYCMDTNGTLTIHPAKEGENIYDATDSNGFPFIKEMTKKKNGWINYPWKNPGEKVARRKIVRYLYFEPWDWIVAVGSYETEFYKEANLIKDQIFYNMLVIIAISVTAATLLVFWTSAKLTSPIKNMIDSVRQIKRGKLDERMPVSGNDEIGELADNFNRMIEIIEKQKEMERMLNQQLKMASLGVLASEVAHEINNPLGVILGYASHMEGKVSPGSAMHEYVLQMKKESQRCKKIVENFLNFARIPNPELKKCDINELLGEITAFAINHEELRHVKFIKRFDTTLPMIMVDEDQIKQVAINLIWNSAAAIKDRGEISITTERGLEGYINLIFQDNGEGIPAEILNRIFEPFFTTKVKGTGLGLAITKQIIKHHFGNIRIESEKNKGTTAIISLPIERESA